MYQKDKTIQKAESYDRTHNIARIIEIGKQEPMQDFDISPIKEEAHDFITKDIYSFNS